MCVHFASNQYRREIKIMDVKTRIETAKLNLKKAEQAKTIAETQLESAKTQQEEILKEMAELGVTPETIDAEIARLETEMSTQLAEAERLIPIL